jgi:Flp pilus assembly protein TadG
MATHSKKGSATLEFTLVGIPALFLLISIFEISRGMWTYDSLSAAVNAGARYASLHGQGCSATGYQCGIAVEDVARKIAASAPGILPSDLTVTLTSAVSGTITCSPLSSCLTNTTPWPPAASHENAPGKEILVAGQYTFRSALAMVVPASAPVQFAVTHLSASSRQVIQF